MKQTDNRELKKLTKKAIFLATFLQEKDESIRVLTLNKEDKEPKFHNLYLSLSCNTALAKIIDKLIKENKLVTLALFIPLESTEVYKVETCSDEFIIKLGKARDPKDNSLVVISSNGKEVQSFILMYKYTDFGPNETDNTTYTMFNTKSSTYPRTPIDKLALLLKWESK